LQLKTMAECQNHVLF